MQIATRPFANTAGTVAYFTVMNLGWTPVHQPFYNGI